MPSTTTATCQGCETPFQSNGHGFCEVCRAMASVLEQDFVERNKDLLREQYEHILRANELERQLQMLLALHQGAITQDEYNTFFPPNED